MQTEKTGVIYRIYHKGSMKSYIGKSVNPTKRFWEHQNGRRSSPALQNAIKKYGKDAFVVKILEKDMPESWLSKLEILHIRFYNSVRPYGYNLTSGGEGLRNPSEETLRKMSKARQGQTSPMKGRRHSLESRKKISDAQKGKRQGQDNPFYGKSHSVDTRRKISKKKQGHIPWNKGKTDIYSDETRRSISESLKGNTPWIKGKTHSAKSRRKMSEAVQLSGGNKGEKNPFYGKKHSAESRRKMSEARKRNTGEKSSFYGKKHSAESRRKMSKAAKGRIPVNKGKTGIYSDEHRLKLSETRRRPEYNEARLYYFLTLSPNMPLKEKRKHLYDRFPNVKRATIRAWVRRWESERNSKTPKESALIQSPALRKE